MAQGIGTVGKQEGKKVQGALGDARAECGEPSGCFCSRRRAFAGGKRIKSLAASKIPSKMQWLWADLCAVASEEMGCAGLVALCKAEQLPASSQAVANALVRCEAQAVHAEPGSTDSARAAVKRELLQGKGVCSERDSTAMCFQHARRTAARRVQGGAHPAVALKTTTSPVFGISSKCGVQKG